MKYIAMLIFCFFGINLSAQMPNSIPDNEKIYGLSKFWQEVTYNFVYWNKVDKTEWENAYKDLITEVQKTENDYEYYRLLQRFCASLNDGHTNVYFPDTIRKTLYNTHFGEYRLFLTNIEGKAIVTRTNLSKKDEIPAGTEVIKVNGIDTKTYLEKEVIPFISSSTDYIRKDRAVSNMFRAPAGTSFNVTFRLPDGTHIERKLTHKKTKEKEVYPEFEDGQLFEFKWIDEEVAYISLNSFSDPKINSLFIEKLPELYKAEKLIIDLRKNGGGNTKTGRDILQYLTNDTLLYGSKTQSRLHIPSFKAWGKPITEKDTIGNKWATQAYLNYHDKSIFYFPYEADTIRLEAKRLVVPTAILTGHNTASAAEDFLIYTENQEHMIKIGGPTFGSTGQPMTFTLPGGGSARVCTKQDTYPNGKEFVGYGIQPDIKIEKKLDDYLNDNDPVLQKAIGYLKKK
ncbi:MAG: S41 family peptidase [Bacteroidales bacterium]